MTINRRSGYGERPTYQGQTAAAARVGWGFSVAAALQPACEMARGGGWVCEWGGNLRLRLKWGLVWVGERCECRCPAGLPKFGAKTGTGNRLIKRQVVSLKCRLRMQKTGSGPPITQVPLLAFPSHSRISLLSQVMTLIWEAHQ